MNQAAFESGRDDVLRLWHTGSAIVFEETLALQRALPRRKRAALAMAGAAEAGGTLTVAPVASPSLDAHGQDLRALWESGAQLHLSIIDRFTCNARFAEADAAAQRSTAAEGPTLDGLPIVTRGLAATRRIITETPEANQADICGIDPRLAAEFALAAGFTSLRGGPISAIERVGSGPAAAARAANAWAYIDQLCGRLTAAGAPVHREVAGAVAVTIQPPGIRCALLVLEALAAAEQGVRSLSLAVGSNLHIVQDVAAVHVARQMTEHYLAQAGIAGTAVTTILGSWSGALPVDLPDAYAVLSLAAPTAVLAGAQALALRQGGDVSRTAARVRMLRAGITMACAQRLPAGDEIALEIDQAKREGTAIVDRVIALGEGSASAGIMRGVEAGVLDLPGGALAGRPCAALPIRDAMGAVRYLATGKLPFDSDTRAFHADRVRTRVGASESAGIGMMLRDLKLENMEVFS